VGRPTETSLHERLVVALGRAARAQHDSRVLITECHNANAALRETVATVHRQRRARAAAHADR
jgi:hypothetical protein